MSLCAFYKDQINSNQEIVGRNKLPFIIKRVRKVAFCMKDLIQAFHLKKELIQLFNAKKTQNIYKKLLMLTLGILNLNQ